MITFDEFKVEWLGKRVDYDHIYGFQCVDLIRQGFYEMYNLPGGGGVPSAITYWQATPDEVLQKFIRIPNSDAQKGDVVILWGLPGNADGHIGWATGNVTATTVEILEQNGSTGNGSGTGGDAIRTRFVDRSRVAGLLRPIVVPQASVFTTSVTPFATTQQFTHTGSLWDLDQPNFDVIRDNPLSDTNPNPVTITAYLTRSDLPQYVYLLPNATVHHGYNKLDCTPYTPPPAPYVPPAAPISTTPAEKYRLIKTIPAFAKPSEALNHRGVMKTALNTGDYFVIAKDGMCYNLSDDNMKDKQQWINIVDNIPEHSLSLPVDLPPVVSTPVDVVAAPLPVEQGSVPKPLFYDWIDGVNHQPVWFHTQNVTGQKFKDLENHDAPQAILPPNKDVRFSMVTIKNGMNYYIPTLSLNAGYRHGVPETLLKPVTPTESFLDNTESDISDWATKLIETPKKVYGLISDIAPARRNKLIYQGKQFIDGFKKGVKK